MEEKILKRLIEELPVHTAPVSLWNKIEVDLWHEENVGEAIKTLPVYEYPEEGLLPIIQRLEREQKNRRIKMSVLGIAASLLLIAGLFVFNTIQNTSTIIVYEETYTPTKQPLKAITTDNELTTMIAAYCINREEVCEDGELHELMGQLNELDQELKQLNVIYPAYVSDNESPDLIKMKLKIENIRDEILKDIMNIILT